MKICDMKKKNEKVCGYEADHWLKLSQVDNKIHLCQLCYFDLLSRVKNNVEIL